MDRKITPKVAKGLKSSGGERVSSGLSGLSAGERVSGVSSGLSGVSSGLSRLSGGERISEVSPGLNGLSAGMGREGRTVSLGQPLKNREMVSKHKGIQSLARHQKVEVGNLLQDFDEEALIGLLLRHLKELKLGQMSVEENEDIIHLFPYQYNKLLEFNITQSGMNEHIYLNLRAIIDEEDYNCYIDGTDEGTQIRAFLGDGTELFQGLVLDVKVENIQDVHYLILHGVSNSYQMDIVKEKCSFQDPALPYDQLVRSVVSKYPKADYINHTTGDLQIGKFVMQYLETDWEFLKRMSSKFFTGLIALSTGSMPLFFFGLPIQHGEPRELFSHNYQVKKDISRFHRITQNNNMKLSEHGFVYFEVATRQIFHLGEQVMFQGNRLYIGSLRRELDKGALMNHYTLAMEMGLIQKEVFNQQIIGASIGGTVLAVAEDHVKVQMSFDGGTTGKNNYWFPFSTTYATGNSIGWYMMPEVGDSVRVYFPSKREFEAIAISSVRQENPAPGQPTLHGGIPQGPSGGGGSGGGGSGGGGGGGGMSNPEIKVLQNADGKTIVLAPDKIEIIGDGVSIVLSDGDGISISSSSKVTIIADEKIVLEGESVVFSADDKIEISCNGNSIKLEDKMEVMGTEVRAN